MFYKADLHLHSHYADATSKFLCLETVYQWALVKGIDIVGTGDFTHPAWLKELEEKLQPAGNGFYTLKEKPAITILPDLKVPYKEIRFCLSTEVCCEYIINGRQYKNHHLIYAPDITTAYHINKALAKYADLSIDGRPTLPITAHQLFSIILDVPKANFIPAHVWTPWYSVLGAMNGHDSLQACFKDLTGELFAVETSLSGDPVMCRRYTALDGLTLVSNSDAHSAPNLGREVNLFDTATGYDAMFEAIRTKKGFLGTYEYYPEHGKYYNDGHRLCKVSIDPVASHNGICAVCGKPLTIGVGHRVEQLADRHLDAAKELILPFKYIIPLDEVYAEIKGSKRESRKVQCALSRAITTLGNELDILHELPLEEIGRYDRRLGMAISRLREDRKNIVAGYDGIYGTVRFFDEKELRTPKAEQATLFKGRMLLITNQIRSSTVHLIKSFIQFCLAFIANQNHQSCINGSMHKPSHPAVTVSLFY